jgi:4-amino-4-deoxy-L-arabinose transferase-like glycosyltransferase
VQLVTVAPVYVGLCSGHLSTPAPLFPYGLDHPAAELPLLTLAARLPSLLMAAGVVVLALRTGTVLRDARTGRWAALLAALLYPMIFYARTTNVDMGALFWTAAGLLVFARCLRGDTTARRLWALGLFAALAAASKDANYAAFVPVGALVTWWWVRARVAGGASFGAAMVAPLQAGAIAAATYAVASGLIFRPSRFQQHLQYVTNGSGTSAFYFRYPPTVNGYLAFAQEFGWQFVDAMGWPLLACALAGLVAWRGADRRLRLWALPALSICLLVIVPVRFALLRFVLPVVYVLVFPGADLLARALGSVAAALAARVAAVVIVGWTAARGVDLTWQMLTTRAPPPRTGCARPTPATRWATSRSATRSRMPDGVTPAAATDARRAGTTSGVSRLRAARSYERVHERRCRPGSSPA